MKYEIESAGETSFVCDCCGNPARRVWGYLESEFGECVAYFVQWTPGAGEAHGAFFDFVIGNWGEGTSPADRAVASLEFRKTDSDPAFMVIDASKRGDFATVAARTLSRSDVMGSPLAKQVFALVDAVWLQEGRIRELTGEL